MAASKQATGMVVVPPRRCVVTPMFIDDLTEDLRVALPGYEFRIIADYFGRQNKDFFVEANGRVPDDAIDALQAVLARYGDSNKTTLR